MTKLEDAIIFATESHADQVDKGGAPYILHPLRVMDRLETEVTRITAVLHDVVEDCGVSLEVIGFVFGSEVREAVDGCTRREAHGVTPRETYADFIERACQNENSRLVKLFDVFDNMSPARQGALSEEEQVGMTKRYARTLPLLAGSVDTWAEAGEWVQEHGGSEAVRQHMVDGGFIR